MTNVPIAIREDNPSLESLHRADYLEQLEYLRIGGILLLIFFGVIMAGATVGLFRFIGFVLGATGVIMAYNRATAPSLSLPKELRLPVPPYTYNTEFLSLLPDNSTIVTVVYFQLPASQQGHANELDRITEKELLLFVARQTTPPSANAIAQHLRFALVQFQNEFQISFLRVDVTFNAHAPAKQAPPAGPLYV